MKTNRIFKGILKWTGLAILLLLVIGGLWVFVAYWRSTNECGRDTVAPKNPMKAVTHCDYGTPEVLRVEQVEKPVPNDDQLLVRVRAASVNPYDWHFIRGTPYLVRMGSGLRKPKSTKLGVDYAGVVEAVGKNVTGFKPGDEVFGGRDGAFAQYVCGRATGSVALKPANISFEQAASVPIAAVTALQAVRDKAGIQPGQKILINGASGGVGTFAVQIAKALGANVTGVCSTKNLELVRSLGADQVIDYTKEDFAKRGERYDALLDNVPNHSLAECRQVLNPKGKYVMIGGGGPNDGKWIGPFGRVIHAMLAGPFVSQKMSMMIANLNHEDLAVLADMMETGKVKPVIDRTYKLEDVAAAVAYVEQGHARGKVVLTID